MTTTMIGDKMSILYIGEVGYRHSGMYTCRAQNDAGTVSHSAELKVNGELFNRGHWKYFYFAELPEIIPFSFGSEAINQGKFAQLTCVISSGDEPLRITWSLKGDVISSDPIMSTTMVGTRMSTLMISSVSYRHSGVYTCRASNPAGSVTYSTQLRVNGEFTKRHRKHWNYCICRTTRNCSIFVWV